MHSLSTSEFQIEYIFKFYSKLLTVIIYKTVFKNSSTIECDWSCHLHTKQALDFIPK